ncbi:uncharacterized protein SCHCODRAFT_02630340, partial [Schizophyllum commune H4-8]|uniref:uncharacterized protein n=1 Tax=Schizophyllum commune (strain H4-8 / FGSC 9210) TaxID=578458 RepID=UPI00215E2324
RELLPFAVHSAPLPFVEPPTNGCPSLTSPQRFRTPRRAPVPCVPPELAPPILPSHLAHTAAPSPAPHTSPPRPRRILQADDRPPRRVLDVGLAVVLQIDSRRPRRAVKGTPSPSSRSTLDVAPGVASGLTPCVSSRSAPSALEVDPLSVLELDVGPRRPRRVFELGLAVLSRQTLAKSSSSTIAKLSKSTPDAPSR